MDKTQPTMTDLTEAQVRKRVFRDEGKALSGFRDEGKALSGKIERGTCVDGPDAIARLMERAFQTGLAMRNMPGLDDQDFDVPLLLTDADFPASVRQRFPTLRQLLGFHGDGSKRRETTIKGLVLIMLPRQPGAKDQWLSPILGKQTPFSLDFVNRMDQLGLFQRPVEVDGGWMITHLNEWGFELLMTGKTTDRKIRAPGLSQTYSQFEALLGGLSPGELLEQTAGKFGFVQKIEVTPSIPAMSIRL